jgi:predicted SnoaL-like aldol condensation-catalyzing enzyme
MRNPIELAHLFADIMNSHDANRFAELVSENYVNHNPAVAPGRAGVVAIMGHRFDTLSDTRVTAYRARHTGPFVGVPASGADIIMRSIDIWRVENDRFVEHWDEPNLLEVFQQMGAIPAPRGATR